uniref:Zinc finger protein 568-like n=1 Tax=Saccoglossus kowalevskii TaxID=10224 RepID=A0ABM0MBQ0_SACKO|nr:PREDICTED: zinc finger protein 568-like [Saccoglossus kowalevskii]
MASKSQKIHPCLHCGKNFVGKKYLLGHMRIHTGEKLDECEICGKSYTWKSSLVSHMKKHTNEKPYKCTKCSKSFDSQDIQEAHIRMHIGVEPYQCQLCARGFTQKSNLKLHMRTHTGEKPYKCELCGKECALKSNLAIHMRTHNTAPKESYAVMPITDAFTTYVHDINATQLLTKKAFQCGICGEGFSNKCAFDYHRKSHPSKEQTFKQLRIEVMKNIIDDHMKTAPAESDIKRYFCKECGEGFSHKCGLGLHVVTHRDQRRQQKRLKKKFGISEITAEHQKYIEQFKSHVKKVGKKRLLCELCGKSFNKEETFQAHIFKVHDDSYQTAPSEDDGSYHNQEGSYSVLYPTDGVYINGQYPTEDASEPYPTNLIPSSVCVPDFGHFINCDSGYHSAHNTVKRPVETVSVPSVGNAEKLDTTSAEIEEYNIFRIKFKF